MATSAIRTALNAELLARGLTDANGVVVGALNRGQVEELMAVCEARGCDATMLAPTDATAYDQFVIAPIASQTNTITITAAVPGTQKTTGITTLAIADAGGDTLAVTYSSGVLAIALANTTDSKNTLTLIKAALDAAVAGAGGFTTFITGTASTQMVHGGTNTRVASVAGAAAGTGVKSSTAGLGAFSIKPV